MNAGEKTALSEFLQEEGMDLLVFFPKKEAAYVCNYRGDIIFQMKTDPRELIKEVRRRNA